VGKNTSDANVRLLAKTAELIARVHGVPIAASKATDAYDRGCGLGRRVH
jgi:hypothetical protein